MFSRRRPVTTAARTIVGATAMAASALGRISSDEIPGTVGPPPPAAAVAADALVSAARLADGGLALGSALADSLFSPAEGLVVSSLPESLRKAIQERVEVATRHGQAEIAHSRVQLADAMATAIDEVLQHVLSSPAMEEATERAMSSPTAQRAVESALAGPLITRALAHQGEDLARGVAEGVRSRAPGADLAADRLARLALWLQLTDRDEAASASKSD